MICYIRKVFNISTSKTLQYLFSVNDKRLFDIIPDKFGDKLEEWIFSYRVEGLRELLGIKDDVEPLERIVLPPQAIDNEEIDHALQIVRDKCLEIRAASKVGIIINIFIHC